MNDNFQDILLKNVPGDEKKGDKNIVKVLLLTNWLKAKKIWNIQKRALKKKND